MEVLNSSSGEVSQIALLDSHDVDDLDGVPLSSASMTLQCFILFNRARLIFSCSRRLPSGHHGRE